MIAAGSSRLATRLAAAIGCLALAAASLPAREPAPAGITRPFLWKIERAGFPASWILGTIHLPRPVFAALHPAIDSALREAGAVYTEIPNDPATLAAIAPRMLLPPGRSLEEELPPDVRAAARRELARMAPQLPFDALRRLQPWAFAVSLVMLEDELKYPREVAMDAVIYRRASAAGKIVGGLETPDDQLAIFGELSAAEQITLVRDTLTQLRELGGSPGDILASLYLAGDLPALAREMERWNGMSSDPGLTARFLERILFGRNESLARAMVARLEAPPRRACFFAVGAAHLEGPRGILARLEKAGFTLTRMQ